jgi:hypothetical protein
MLALYAVGRDSLKASCSKCFFYSIAAALGGCASTVLLWNAASYGMQTSQADMNSLFSAKAVVELQDEKTRAWHVERVDPHEGAGMTLGDEDAAISQGIELSAVVRQHRANFDLWHIEDEARTPGATDAQLAAVKRRIDSTNQLRNDLVEEVDRFLIAWLNEHGLPNREAPLNSETPGLMIDRLSILSLKIYHTRDEAVRADAPEGHAERNRERLSILEEQRADLAGCLDALWAETLAGTRRFKLYRQLKMYNDPALNPAIYNRRSTPR